MSFLFACIGLVITSLEELLILLLLGEANIFIDPLTSKKLASPYNMQKQSFKIWDDLEE